MKAKTTAPKPANPKPGPAKKTQPPKKPVVIEDDIPIPEIGATHQSDADADRSQSAYPATVSSLKQEIRPATPSLSEIKDSLKVNYSDFGSRIDEKLRQHLRLTLIDLEAKERHSADLGQEILTRKRLLAAVQAASGQLDERFLKTQLQARDGQIAILSERLFDLTARAKLKGQEEAKSRDSLISVLQQQVDALTATASQQQATISDLLLKDHTEITGMKAEREQMAMLQEALQEELEATRLKLTQKDRILQDSKSDLAQLAKIISDMTAINKDLNEKIIGLNKDMEEINTANFQYKVKVENVEQLEATINGLLGNKAMYEKQFEKLTQSVSTAEGDKDRLRVTMENLRKECGEISERVRGWVKTIAEMTSWDSVAEEVKTTLLQVKTGLDEETMALEGVCKTAAGADSHRGPALESDKRLSELKILDKEKSLQIEELKRSLSALESSKSTLSARISTLESDISKRRSDTDKLLSQKDADIKQLREQVDSLKQQSMRLVEQRNDHELSVSKAQTQVTVLLEKIETIKQGQENYIAKTRLADQQQRMVGGQLTQVNKQMAAKEKEAVQRELTLKQLTMKLKIMEQELWNKDSEVVSRESRILELSAEIQSLRSEIDQSTIKARKMIAEQLADIHRMLEEKDHEISILKGMLRSVQTQVKQKEVDIVRYKRKAGELPSEPYSPKKLADHTASQRASSTNYDELHQAVSSFLSQIDRLRKFSALKLEKIAEAEAAGTVTPQWLKDELKLAKLPGEAMAAKDVLRGSLEHRISSLISQVQSVYEKTGRSDEVAQEVVMSLGDMRDEKWEGLVDTLRKYSTREVLEGCE